MSKRKVSEIFSSMAYGPAPEAADSAKAWIESHGGAFGHECTKGNNPMSERNYPCDDLIYTFFGDAALASLNETGEGPFKRQLYQCMLAQSLLMAQTHSVMRAKNWAPAYPQNAPAAASSNTFGILVWMVSERSLLARLVGDRQLGF